ncbi:MAG: biotin/lipoyl-binding protein [Bdellovibrionales bacterium]
MLAKLHAAFLALLASLGLGDPGPVSYQGYGEGEYVLVAPQIAGTLETLNVARGQTVHKGELLFTLEHADETAALSQAKAEAERARSTLADLTKGKRPTELDTLVALRDQAAA